MEDGKSPDVIRQLAHNEWEVERMTAENDSIKHRQLVYRNEPINVTIERARAAGQPLTNITLPALDGAEYEVEVSQNNVSSEKMTGSLSGHLKDRPNSMASIGFVNGYESFNLLSPDDGLYIVADSREPGEVMVKEIDPSKYGLVPNNNAPDFIPTKQAK